MHDPLNCLLKFILPVGRGKKIPSYRRRPVSTSDMGPGLRRGDDLTNAPHFGKRVILIVLLAVLCAPMPAHAQEIEQKAEDPQDFVSTILPYSIDDVHERALLLFNSDRRDYYDDYNAKIYALPEAVNNYKDLSPNAYKQFMALPIVRPNKFYVFYGAYPNVQDVLAAITPLSVMGHSNTALQRYAALPAESRAYDLYIWSPDTPYWYSEYFLNGQPLPFKSYFILHLAAVDATHTQVEVIENEPVIRIGHQMSVDIHGILHHYQIREVEPTTSDREFLLSCVEQFIERKVPGRHWFNCRQKGEVVETPTPFTVP